ncbi:MAG: hypothetical protein R3F59_06855 [Myxococcota bacterium]
MLRVATDDDAVVDALRDWARRGGAATELAAAEFGAHELLVFLLPVEFDGHPPRRLAARHPVARRHPGGRPRHAVTCRPMEADHSARG